MIEFHILTTAQYAETLSAQLNLLGALAVTWEDAGDQPIYEPKPDEHIEWDLTKIVALFEDAALVLPISNYLTEQQQQHFLLNFETREVPEQDWVRASLDLFIPTQFGKRLWICPTWHTPPAPDAVNIIFDPGLAFGTGSHATTALCLEWLDENIRGGEIIMDYGCGSGILAIAALKLGASQAIAIDHDSQALDATRMNAELNHISSTQLSVHLPQEVGKHQVDILLANILAKPLIEFAPLFATFVKPRGKLVLSGILPIQMQDVICAYQNDFTLQAQIIKDEWVRLDWIRN